MKKNRDFDIGWSSYGLRKMFLTMKLFVCIFLLGVSSVWGRSFSQVKISMSMKNAAITDVFKEITRLTGYEFMYSGNELEDVKPVNVEIKDQDMSQVLALCLKNTGLWYVIDDRVVIISPKLRKNVSQQKGKLITGKVVDKNGGPLPGVTILLKGTTLGCMSDQKGLFHLSIPDKMEIVLVFSFVGMKTKEIAIKNTEPLNVVLEQDVADLDEVTVIAYGERKKRELISSISSVKAEDIKEIPTASFVSLLQGRMAGIEITNQSGAPGGGGTVVAIRGYNSLFDGKGSDGTPLYVVDGVPIHSFTSPVTGTNALAELDPSTIESVEVLKDAASAAIYGSRAGNGVILITTKKGRKGEAKFSANVSYSGSMLPEAPFQLGGRLEREHQLLSLRAFRKAYKNYNTGETKYPSSYEESADNYADYDYFWNQGMGRSVVKWLQDSLNPFYNNSTNWFKQVFRTGKIINANLQATGGSDLFQYMLGAGYYKESGIMYGSDFARVNLISNMTVLPVRNLRIDNRIYLAYTDRSRGPGANSLVSAQKIETLTVDPSSTSTVLPGGGEVAEKVLEKLNGTVSKQDDYRLRANLVLDYMFIKGLHLSVSGAVDFGQSNSNVFEPSYLDAQYEMSKSTGRIFRNIMLQNENMLKYNFSIQEKHNVDILLGLSVTKNQSFQNTGWGRGGNSDLIYYVDINMGSIYNFGNEWYDDWQSQLSYNSSFSENVMLSYYGRLAYNFQQRYLMEFTLRRDGSSVFGENHRYATFPSIALGWAFSEESFMKGISWLDFGKIRGSWGKSGQIFSSDYLAHGLMRQGLSFNGKRGMTSDGIINKDLTWEKSDQYDIGLDADLFNYRLKFKFDYYYKYTKGLLYNVQIPGNVYGSDQQDQNAMEVSNEGLELELQADVFRNTKVTWRTRFNITRNWNRFEKSYLGTDIDDLVIGKPLVGLYLWDDKGIYQREDQLPVYYNEKGEKIPFSITDQAEPFAPGSRIIRDLDGNGVINEDDKYYAGATYPLASGGWAHELTWKNFDLNLLFTYSLGRKMVRVYGVNSLNGDYNGTTPLFEDIRGKHFFDGTDQPSDYPMRGMFFSSPQFSGLLRSNMERVRWCKLKQLTLGYNLERNIVRKLHLSGVRVFVTGENLFTMTNYSGIDPEVVSINSGVDEFRAYPLARKWTIGLTVNF